MSDDEEGPEEITIEEPDQEEDIDIFDKDLLDEWGSDSGLEILAKAHDRSIKTVSDPRRLPFFGRIKKGQAERYKRKYAIAKAWPVDLISDILQSEMEIDCAINGDRIDVLLDINKALRPGQKGEDKKRGIFKGKLG